MILSLRKDKGIVVQSRIFNDHDIVITLLSEFGIKSKFRFSGIKKSKKRPIICTEIGSYISLDYYFHDKFISNIKEASIVDRFESVKTNYKLFLLLNYICELSDRLFVDGEVHLRGFKLLYASLKELNENPFDLLFLPFFKLRLLKENGLVSDEFLCTHCMEPARIKKAVSFLPCKLELICEDCDLIKENHIQIVSLMEEMMNIKFAIMKNNNVPSSLIKTSDKIINQYLNHYLDIELKSFKFLYEALEDKI